MITIEVWTGDIERAIKSFRKKTEGVLRDLKEHAYFVSKGERRREQVRKGIRRARKRERKKQEWKT